MNFTQTFEEFSRKLSTTDLALYAGVGLVLWVLFKDKLSPVQTLVLSVVEKVKGLLGNKNNIVDVPVLPVVSKPVVNSATSNNEDLFFRLVVSWKQTRDLAVQSGCNEAVKVADQMFPFLSPTVCADKKEVVV
jgi:hypothetical protein